MSINESNNDSIINYIFWSCFIYVSWKILNKLWTLSDQYLLPYFRKPIDFKYYGQWAVITGSTDGIGKGFAEELAAKGLDICLISRNEEKLINTAKHIEERYNVNTKYIVADFTDPNIYTHIGENLKDLDIGVLVNNVGIVHIRQPLFINLNESIIKDYLNVNVLSTLMMSSIVIPVMIPKKKGLIINISSLTAELSVPYYLLYSSTKACVKKFGKTLNMEMKKHNIQVKTFTPGVILTNMLHQAPKLEKLYTRLPYGALSVKTFVNSALKVLNSISDLSCGYFATDIHLMIVKCLPEVLLISQANKLVNIKDK